MGLDWDRTCVELATFGGFLGSGQTDNSPLSFSSALSCLPPHLKFLPGMNEGGSNVPGVSIHDSPALWSSTWSLSREGALKHAMPPPNPHQKYLLTSVNILAASLLFIFLFLCWEMEEESFPSPPTTPAGKEWSRLVSHRTDSYMTLHFQNYSRLVSLDGWIMSGSRHGSCVSCGMHLISLAAHSKHVSLCSLMYVASLSLMAFFLLLFNVCEPSLSWRQQLCVLCVISALSFIPQQ